MVSVPLVCSAPSVPQTGGAFSNFFALSSPFEADIISLQIVIFVKYKTQKGSYDDASVSYTHLNFTTYPVNTIEYQGQTWSVESGDIVSA